MTRGRKQPISHHKKTGNYRPSRHGNADLPVEVPAMPGDLSGVAAATWHVVIENLTYAGLVSRIDGTALRRFCEATEIYVEAMDDIRSRGIVVTEVTADGLQRVKKNPAVDVRHNAWKEIAWGLRQFGLTPASRTGLRRSENLNTDENNRIAEILGIGVAN